MKDKYSKKARVLAKNLGVAAVTRGGKIKPVKDWDKINKRVGTRNSFKKTVNRGEVPKKLRTKLSGFNVKVVK